MTSKIRANSSDWVEFYGDICPVDLSTKVEVRLRCGLIRCDFAGEYDWEHLGLRTDIVAYRVV